MWTQVTRRELGWLGGGAAFALAGCNTPARKFRENLAISVDTPEGTLSGSSVTEHETAFQDGWLGGLANHSLLNGSRGEATVVDLGSAGLLIALLVPDETRGRRGSAPGGYEYTVFNDRWAELGREFGGNYVARNAGFIDWLNREKPKAEVPFDILGLFVRFRDPNDPKTVERVDPSELAASFGSGVHLARVTIEITDAPLSSRIEKYLPWLDRLRSSDASLDGDASKARAVIAPLANKLFSGNFKTGM
jgi:hypothetical protein